MITEKWDRRFIELARHIGQWSKDPSTKVGAVLVDPDNRRVVSTGYNGFPVGHSDDKDLYADREYKYRHVVHAEENALKFIFYKAPGLHAYTSFPCCPNCVLALSVAGVRRIVQPALDITNRPQPWIDEWATRLQESQDLAQRYKVEMISLHGI